MDLPVLFKIFCDDCAIVHCGVLLKLQTNADSDMERCVSMDIQGHDGLAKITKFGWDNDIEGIENNCFGNVVMNAAKRKFPCLLRIQYQNCKTFIGEKRRESNIFMDSKPTEPIGKDRIDIKPDNKLHRQKLIEGKKLREDQVPKD